jgi:hypothetical protein
VCVCVCVCVWVRIQIKVRLSLLSAVCCLLSAVYSLFCLHLLSFACSLLPVVGQVVSAVRFLLSAISSDFKCLLFAPSVRFDLNQ